MGFRQAGPGLAQTGPRGPGLAQPGWLAQPARGNPQSLELEAAGLPFCSHDKWPEQRHEQKSTKNKTTDFLKHSLEITPLCFVGIARDVVRGIIRGSFCGIVRGTFRDSVRDMFRDIFRAFVRGFVRVHFS